MSDINGKDLKRMLINIERDKILNEVAALLKMIEQNELSDAKLVAYVISTKIDKFIDMQFD